MDVGAIHDLVYGPSPAPLLRAMEPPVAVSRLTPPEPGHGLPVNLGTLIEEAVASRMALFSLSEALRMPPVIRGVQLICSTLAQMSVVGYRDEVVLEFQPRILRRPSPFVSRYEFVYQTVYSLLAGDENAAKPGNAWWFITDRDSEDLPRAVIQLPGGEVSVEWDTRRFQPITRWRGRVMESRDLIHIAIGRPPGALLGRSPIEQGLDALAVAATAERFASAWFLTSGVPSVAIKVQEKISEDEANKLKAQWMEAHGVEPTPAVLSGGIDLDYPDIDPQRSQMTESREQGNTVVARLLGIPAALLHVSTSGATITYTNPAGAIEELVKATIAPTYMPPLEFAFGELLPSTQSARFNARELLRVDISTRYGIYKDAVALGVLDATDVRAIEGWPRTGPVTGLSFSPQPAAPSAPTPAEVPSGV